MTASFSSIDSAVAAIRRGDVVIVVEPRLAGGP
jgi:hypothetical protein